MSLKNSSILTFAFLFLVLSVSAADLNPSPPEGCVSWFDGCNTCAIGENGVWGCTKIACETAETPFCLKYACDLAGEINYSSNEYCSTEGFWEELKEDNSLCVNDYECSLNSCVDGLCQSIYSPIAEHGNLLKVIWDKFGGIQCDPSNQDYHCEGQVAYLCGILGVYEEKGKIKGVCGYNDGDTGTGGSGGDGGGSCVANWDCTSWSSPAGQCGTRTCTLKNSCNKDRPIESKTCGTASLCGNNVCDSGERISCPGDCSVVNTCGDGFCGNGESSANCPSDCDDPAEPKNYRWVLILIIAVLFSSIIFVSLIIWNKFKEEDTPPQKNNSPKTNSSTPPKDFNKSK